MPWDENLRNLKDVLVNLYSQEADYRVVIRDASLREGNIRFTGMASTDWSEILNEADKHKKISDIIKVALQEYPRNEFLLSAQRNMLTPVKRLVSDDLTWSSSNPIEALEKIMGKQSTLLPINWLEVGLLRSRSVAKVKLVDNTYGTGFLIRNNLFLTCHHVLRTADEARTASIQFNYQQHTTGRSYEPANVELAPDAVFETSEWNDWSLVRVKGDANSEWGAIDLEPVSININDPVIIIQHPGGGAKQITFYHNIIAYVDNTHVQYLADTLPGSSGAAVFDDQWRLIAVHHAGGSIIELSTKKPVYRNEGININCILHDLKRLNL